MVAVWWFVVYYIHILYIFVALISNIDPIYYYTMSVMVLKYSYNIYMLSSM